MPKTATAPKTGDKRMSQDFHNESQSWYYEALWNFMGKKLRVNIRRNAYDFQSSLKVCIYEPEKNAWNGLCSLPMTEQRRCFSVSYTDRNPDIKLFEADEAELLKKAALILG